MNQVFQNGPRQPHRFRMIASLSADSPVSLAASLLFALSLTSPPAPGHALMLDIRGADAAQVEATKQTPGVAWWLELGDRLLLVEDDTTALTLPAAVARLEEWSALTPNRLALRLIDGDAAREAPGRLLARAGHWQLRLLEPGTALPQARDESEAWHGVEPNEVLAQRYRPDPARAAPPDPAILPVVEAIDSQRWFNDLAQLSNWDRSSYGTTGLFAARDWIGARFADLGLAVAMQDFTMPGPGGTITRQNVVGTWTGTTWPDEWIVIGAHYDSRNGSGSSVSPTPGAEDNASGCAGVIELARAVLPFQPQRTLVFVCYAGEEQNLYGSSAHVTRLQNEGHLAKVQAVIVMDMIGYSADAQLDVDFESKATWLPYLNRFAAAAATYVPELNVTLSTNPFGSDHMPYLNKNRQTLLAIESDWDVYPYYHAATDLPVNVGPHAQAMGGAILKTNAAMLAELAGVAQPAAVFHDDFEDATLPRATP